MSLPSKVLGFKLGKLTHAKKRVAFKTVTCTKRCVGKCCQSDYCRNHLKMGFTALVAQRESYRHIYLYSCMVLFHLLL